MDTSDRPAMITKFVDGVSQAFREFLKVPTAIIAGFIAWGARQIVDPVLRSGPHFR